MKKPRRAWPGAKPGQKEEGEPPKVRPEDQWKVDLMLQVGIPFEQGERGGISVNERYFVVRFAHDHLALYELKEGEFYFYNEENGAWELRKHEELVEMFEQDWQRIAGEFGEPGLIPKRTNHLMSSLVFQLRGFVAKRDVFKRNGRVIHLINGMLHLGGNLELRPFSPDYYSRNVCPIKWNPEAKCPKFEKFLKSALDPDDISLLRRWAGSLLLTGNAAQRVFLLVGTAGAGKSSLMEIFERIIGLQNVYELRTAHLAQRFELFRCVGKTTLTGKDVPGDFLELQGASIIKKLVGHDQQSAEKKGSNADLPFLGDFNVGITCNSRMRVRLDGDIEAWERRLAKIEFSKPKPKKRILRITNLLLENESEGILNWMVQGAVQHLKECDEIGDYRLTEEQRQRTTTLLAESDSLRHFVVDCIQVNSYGMDLSTDEIVACYFDYCAKKGWAPFPTKMAQGKLVDLMLEIYHTALGTHVVRHEKRVRGYPNVEFKPNVQASAEG
jgi:P4 family phage/plasmid primase-like protien